MIRLVALDLDGTLLAPDHHVSEADGRAVTAARDRGMHVVLCTSRWYGVALRTAHRLELHAPMICHNGAHIKEPDGEELLHRTIPADAARAIAAFCDQGGYETYTTIDGVTYLRSRWDAQIDPARLPSDMRVAHNQAEHVTGPATGIIVFSEEGVRGVVAHFAEQHRDELFFDEAWGTSHDPYVTITAAGVDKGTGLRFVLDRLDLAQEEAMAVGDALPDVAMFLASGVGVAMGNAGDDVKAQATAVAPSNAENGVAWAIERFVLNPD